MKKTSIFRWHEHNTEYSAALILSDRHQPKESEVKVEVPKPWSGGLRVSSTVVRRPALLASK